MKISNFGGIRNRFACQFNQVLLLCCVSLLTPAVASAADSIVIENIRLGVDGYFQVGRQTPIEFSVSSSDSSVKTFTPQLRTVDPDGHGVISTLPSIEVGKTPVVVRTLFRSGKIAAPVQIELLEDEEIVARKVVRVDNNQGIECLQQNSRLWLIAGEQPAYEAAASQYSASQSGIICAADFVSNTERIENSLALESVELIVLNGDTKLSPGSSQIIEDWVQRGGRLVISVGKTVSELKESPIADWLPVLPTDTVKIQNLSSLNQLVPGSEPLRFLAAIDGARFGPTDGTVLVDGLNTPLVVRTAYGLGTVTLVSIAIDKKPISIWESRADFAMLLAGHRLDGKSTDRGPSVDLGLSPTGVTDLQTQIVQALDDYDDIDRPSYWVVIGWGAVLLLIIGPIDYFIVHHLLKRPQLTWLTLPLWLVGMTVWSYSSAEAVNQSNQQMQQIELVDVDTTTKKVRGRAWFNFYSTSTQRYEVAANVNTSTLSTSAVGSAARTPLFYQTSWVDRPETSYRGMYRSGGLEASKPAYHLGQNQQSLTDLPVRVHSTGLLGTEWESDLGTAKVVTSQLRDPGNRRLKGQLTYHGTQELTEWFVAYGNFAYFPRTNRGASQKPLKPGDEFSIDSARSNLLRGVLIGLTHTSIFEDGKMEGGANVNREIYDPLAREPLPILRTLTFHEVTGGTTYTQLSNQSLRSADLSNLINLQRAVLFGRLKSPLTTFAVNGDEGENVQQETVIRYLLPVQVDEIDVDAPPDPTLLKIK